ncbi:MAG: hypothetical protein KAR17_07810, partial [Cyclobacteriaceae bacterium]|nr:hypothetical protein [Cyclobacteriaceae bacterium]
MKKTFSIIIIGFISGIGGSWFYENHISTNLTESHADQIPIVNNEITNADRVSGTESITESDIKNIHEVNAQISSMFRPADFVQASKISTRSVVYIKTISQNRYGSTWMDYFFGEGTGQSINSGSGVIYS